MPVHGSAQTFPVGFGQGAEYKPFVVSDQGYQSYEAGMMLANAGDCVAGLILGRTTRGTRTATPAAKAGGNTGSGVLTMDATTPLPGAGAVKIGVYEVRFVEAVAAGGRYEVIDPDGISLGQSVVGTAFDNILKFNIADGDPDFAVGDGFDITIAETAPSMKLVPLDPAAVDGSENFAGILVGRHQVGAVDKRVAFMARLGEVQRAKLVFDGTPTDDEKDAVYAQMAAQQITLR